MPEIAGDRFSYRHDADVPAFDDSKTLFVFDGVCVLCSSGAGWLMQHDRKGRINFVAAQSAIGQALYRHYGVVMDDSYLLLSGGRAYTASAGYLKIAGILGGRWRAFLLAGVFPEAMLDAVYGLIARNRYRWFGKADYCALLTKEQTERLL